MLAHLLKYVITLAGFTILVSAQAQAACYNCRGYSGGNSRHSNFSGGSGGNGNFHIYGNRSYGSGHSGGYGRGGGKGFHSGYGYGGGYAGGYGSGGYPGGSVNGYPNAYGGAYGGYGYSGNQLAYLNQQGAIHTAHSADNPPPNAGNLSPQENQALINNQSGGIVGGPYITNPGGQIYWGASSGPNVPSTFGIP